GVQTCALPISPRVRGGGPRRGRDGLRRGEAAVARGAVPALSRAAHPRVSALPRPGRLMNPREFLDVGNDLVTGAREGDWRTAVGRGYYTASHLARRVLSRCGFTVPHADQAHAYLWMRLANCGHVDLQY